MIFIEIFTDPQTTTAYLNMLFLFIFKFLTEEHIEKYFITLSSFVAWVS